MKLIFKSVILLFLGFALELRAEETFVDGMWVDNTILHQIFCSSDEELEGILLQKNLKIKNDESFTQSRAKVKNFFSHPELTMTQQPTWETEEMCKLVKVFVENSLACKNCDGSVIDLVPAYKSCH